MTPPPTTTGSHSTHKAKTSPWWWVAAGAGALVMVVSLIIWLGSTNAADGDPLLDNPTAVVVALLAGLSSIAAVVIPKLQAIGNNTSQTAEHVVNSHGQNNLRDDVDEIKELATDIKGIATSAVEAARSAAAQAIAANTRTAALEDLVGLRFQQIEGVQAAQAQDQIGIHAAVAQLRAGDRSLWDAVEDTAARRRQKGSDS